MIMTFLVASLTVLQGSAISGQSQTAGHLVEWEATLRELCDRHNVAVALDLNADAQVPLGLENLSVEQALQLLAAASNRTLSIKDGVHILARTSSDPKWKPRSANERRVSWLRSLDGPTIERLRRGVTYKDLIDTFGMTTTADLLPGGERNAAILADPGASRISLAVWIEVELTNSATGKSTTDWLAPSPIGEPAQSLKDNLVAAKQPPPTEDQVTAPTDGNLILPGRLMTVREVLDVAARQFETGFVIDKRIHEAKVFVRGTFTLERFKAVMADLTRILPLIELEAPDRATMQLATLLGSPEWKERVVGQFEGETEALVRQIMGSTPISLAAVLRASPRFEKRVSDMGWDPGLVRTQAKPAIAFTVTTPSVGDGLAGHIMIVR